MLQAIAKSLFGSANDRYIKKLQPVVDAVNALDRFIKLNPGHANVDYAYYLKALSYYERIVDVGRDQKITQQALDIFTELAKRFPDSKYSRDARLKLDLTRNHLAGKEMSIGRYYLRGGRTMAAINRFKSVIVKFDTTDQVPEALHRLTEAYLAFGLNEDAQKTAAVLGHNFPGNEWYLDSYKIMGNEVAAPKESKPWYKPWN